MASLKQGRPTCIRAAFSTAGFRKWQRRARHRLQVNYRKNHMGFAEGIWRELLDPYDGDSEDALRQSNYRASLAQCTYRFLGNRNRSVPSYALKFKSPEVSVEEPLLPAAPDLTVKAPTSHAPAPLEAVDIDMQPVGETKALGQQDDEGWSTRLSASTEDRTSGVSSPLVLAELSDRSRHLLSRARATLQLPRLGNERDKGPKLSLSKRKLELILAEPVKTKRKKK